MKMSRDKNVNVTPVAFRLFLFSVNNNTWNGNDIACIVQINPSIFIELNEWITRAMIER